MAFPKRLQPLSTQRYGEVLTTQKKSVIMFVFLEQSNIILKKIWNLQEVNIKGSRRGLYPPRKW